MFNGGKVALAVGAGYLLGRTKKMRLALMLAAAGVTGKFPTSPTALVGRGLQSLGASADVAQLTEQLRGELLNAGRAAALAAATNQIDALNDRLQGVTSAVDVDETLDDVGGLVGGGLAGGGKRRRTRSRDDFDEDDAYDEPEEDDEEEPLDVDAVDEDEDEDTYEDEDAEDVDEDQALEEEDYELDNEPEEPEPPVTRRRAARRPSAPRKSARASKRTAARATAQRGR